MSFCLKKETPKKNLAVKGRGVSALETSSLPGAQPSCEVGLCRVLSNVTFPPRQKLHRGVTCCHGKGRTAWLCRPAPQPVVQLAVTRCSKGRDPLINPCECLRLWLEVLSWGRGAENGTKRRKLYENLAFFLMSLLLKSRVIRKCLFFLLLLYAPQHPLQPDN